MQHQKLYPEKSLDAIVCLLGCFLANPCAQIFAAVKYQAIQSFVRAYQNVTALSRRVAVGKLGNALYSSTVVDN